MSASPARRAVSVSGGLVVGFVSMCRRAKKQRRLKAGAHWLARMFGRGCRGGNCFRIVLPCARTREALRPCDNVYIIARHSPPPGCFSSLFELSEARDALISSPLPLFPSKKLPLPHFLHLHSLKHITMPLSLKISPAIEFLSFRQANYALNPKQTLLRDFKGITRNQLGTAQITTY